MTSTGVTWHIPKASFILKTDFTAVFSFSVRLSFLQWSYPVNCCLLAKDLAFVFLSFFSVSGPGFPCRFHQDLSWDPVDSGKMEGSSP